MALEHPSSVSAMGLERAHAETRATSRARLAMAAFGAAFVGVLAYRLLSLAPTDRLFVHDEIPIGPSVVNTALMFGMSFENWEFPNYLLALLNGVDGALGAFITTFTSDWRVMKLVQYAIASMCVMTGFWHASGRVLRDAGAQTDRELAAMRFVATACYTLSPYALTQMNNGTFWAFTVYFAMAFVPSLLALLCGMLVGTRQRLGFTLGLLAGICTWWLPLIVVLACSGFALVVLLPTRAHAARTRGSVRFALGALSGLVPVALTSYFTMVDPGYDVDFKSLANATYGIIQGGILTPILQRFSWILYIGWDTKAVHSFFHAFDSTGVRLSYLASLAMLMWAAVAGPRGAPQSRLLVALLIVFASAIFFAKGASFPFGDLFVAIIEAIPGFGVVRTPDTKFGLVATAALMLAWIAAAAANRVARRGLLVIGAAYLAAALIPFASGELIDPRGPARYRVSLSADQERALRVVNEASGEGRVLAFPGSATGTYPYEGYAYVGRNYLVASIDRPVVSAQEGIVGERHSVGAALGFIRRMDLAGLRDMGIRFVLIDKTKEYGRYHDFSLLLGGGELRMLSDGPRAAVFEITGPGKPVEVVTSGGERVHSSIRRFAHFPAGFILSITPGTAQPGPFEARADEIVSSHWRWLRLAEGDGASWAADVLAIVTSVLSAPGHEVGVTSASRVGLAQWSLAPSAAPPGHVTRWLVVHWPNVALFATMAGCMLLAIALAVSRALGALRPAAPVALAEAMGEA